MQLWAIQKNRELVSVGQARKGEVYFCPECGAALQLRAGELRQLHFYHIREGGGCRHSGKSAEHLRVQKFLLQQLPGSQMERPFSSIGRIADLVWESEKLIFEVQCSPITAREIEERNRDYGSVGYLVVWILHDQRYNTGKSEAERYLFDKLHFFVGSEIYARNLGKKYPVDVQFPLKLPEQVPSRFQRQQIYFRGDLVDRFLAGEIQPEEMYQRKERRFWSPFRALYPLLMESIF